MSRPLPQQRRVLLITDDEVVKKRQIRIFEDAGYTVRFVEDSLEVLSAIDEYQPHVILMLAAFPARMCLEVLDLVRMRRPRSAIPAILISADRSLILDFNSRTPRPISDRPIDAEAAFVYIDRLPIWAAVRAASQPAVGRDPRRQACRGWRTRGSANRLRA